MNLKRILPIVLCVLIAMVFPVAVSASGAYPFDVIEAISYDTTSDSSLFNKKSDDVGSFVAMNARTHSNQWICYKDVDFTSAPYAVIINVATGSDQIAGNTFQVRLDSPTGDLVSTVSITDYIGWHNPVEHTGTITKSFTGVHDVYISANKADDFYNFYFLTKTANTTVPYRVYSTDSEFSDVSGNKYEYAINALCKLEIAKGHTETEFYPELPLLRGEFAKWVARMMTEEVPEDTETIFSDLPGEYDGKNEVNYLYKNGVITLNDTKEFRPYEFISVRDASVMLLRIMGYEKLCQYKGGYPKGFEAVARDIGLTSKMAPDDCLRRGPAAGLLYNAVKSEYLEGIGIENGDIVYGKKNGVLSSLRNVYYSCGKVMSTAYGSLVEDVDLKTGECIIDTQKFKNGSINVEHYLGVKCEYWYKYDESTDTKTLIAVFPYKNVKEEIINSKDADFESITSTLISYEVDDKTKKIKIPTTAIWVYNNHAIDFPISDIVSADTFSGRIRLIDNGNGYETVVAEEYENVKIESFDSANKKLKNELTGVIYDFSDVDLYISDGAEEIRANKLTRGQLCELYFSFDKKVAVLLVGESKVTGAPSELDSKGSVLIDNVWYKKANELKDDIDLGETSDFYLSRSGEIVYVVSKSNVKQIGGLTEIEKENSDLFVTLMTSGNKKVRYKCSEKGVTVDGVKTKNIGDIKLALTNAGQNTPVVFKLNSKSELVMLDTVNENAQNDDDVLTALNTYNSSDLFVYNKSMSIFRGVNSFEMLYPVRDGAVIMLIDNVTEGEKISVNELSSYSTSIDQSFVFYTVKRDSKFADIVYCPDYTSHSRTDFGFFYGLTSGINESVGGEACYVLKFMDTGGSVKNYYVSYDNASLVSDVKGLKKGDALALVLGKTGEVASIDVACRRDGSGGRVSKTSGSNGSVQLTRNFIYGTVKTIEDGFYEVVAFGSEKSYWCKAADKSVIAIDENGNISTGKSSAVVKTGDTLCLYYASSLQWIAVYQ